MAYKAYQIADSTQMLTDCGYVRKAKMYYSNNPKIKPLLLEVEKEKRLAETAAKVQEMKNFFKQPFLISCYAAVINIIIFVIMYINAQAKLSTIPETHKTGFFSMKTPYEEQQDTIFLIIMMGFIITAAIIGAGIYFQRNRKK